MDPVFITTNLVSNNKNLLKPNFSLVALEVGHNQATTVERLMRNCRFSFTDIWTDPLEKPGKSNAQF